MSQSKEEAILQRLDSFAHLPTGSWKYHVGDMAHGETVSLDDSSWQEAKKDQSFSEEAVWFRQWIEVPKTLSGYDLTGSRIWFRFKTSGNPPQIIYFNGRRVALGEDLEPIILFEQAKPGEKVLVAVKILATSGQKKFQGVTTKIDFAANRPNPQDLHQEIIVAQKLSGKLDSSSKIRNIVSTAIDKIDLKALDANDQIRFDASLHSAGSVLEPLKPEMQHAELFLAGNSHIDAAWLWPWTETVDVVRRTFGTALQLMNEYPDYKYTQSAVIYNDWIAQKYPDLDRQIKKRIQEGRWEIVGGMWVEPDLNLPDGESTARSLLIGKRWIKKHYGVDVRIGWNPDSFGYNWQLPQIYKKSGIDYFVTQKISWNDTNKMPLKLFWWQSPDGSKVLTYFPNGYASSNLDPVRLSKDLADSQENVKGITQLLDLYGVGDHGGGPTRAMLDEGVHWMSSNASIPKMEFSSASAFFTSAEKHLSANSPKWDYKNLAKGFHTEDPVNPSQWTIPTWDDELYLEFHRGCYTTQALMKKNLRRGPEWALNAEKYASLAWLQGDAYPVNTLEDAWKTITFNDFHDLAAGSGIAPIYQDAAKEFEGVQRATNEISNKALSTLSAQIDTLPSQKSPVSLVAKAVPVLLFNPLAWRRSGLVTVEVQMPQSVEMVSVVNPEGKVLPSVILSSDAKTNRFRLQVQAKDIPALGYQVVQVVPGKLTFSSDLKVNGFTLENDNLRLVVDSKTGCITSLYQKKANFEPIASGGCGNELQAFEDKPKEYDAWNIDPGTLDKPPMRLTQTESVKLIEQGPMRAVIQIKRKWQKSEFVQNVILYAGSEEVEVQNDVDWHETHMLLKTAFPLSASSPFATYEIPYGTIQRPTTRSNSWEKARFEVPALRWADLGDENHGFSLINDSKYGYDAVDNLLRLSLLRSPTSPDADADRGRQQFSYALYPHDKDWKKALTVRHGYEYNYGLLATQVQAHSGPLSSEHSFVSVGNSNVVLTAMKKAEDSDALIFHFYEWEGKGGSIELRVPSGASAAVLTNLMEQSEGSSLKMEGDRIEVPVHPFEIVSVRVDYPKRAEGLNSSARY